VQKYKKISIPNSQFSIILYLCIQNARIRQISTIMSLLDIILLAIALAMDCFTVSIVSGVISLSKTPFPSKERLGVLPQWLFRMALLFGLFQALMPLIGWLGISHFSHYLEAVDHWIAFGMLAFIGGKMIKESFDEDEERHFDPRHLRTQLFLAIATSIDALAVGISFACTGYDTLPQLTLPLVIIGLASFVLSLVGFYLGRHFGSIITRRLKPELFGGLILIIIGIKILLSHLI
jgi:putative Mn2+ efflux pump MntP